MLPLPGDELRQRRAGLRHGVPPARPEEQRALPTSHRFRVWFGARPSIFRFPGSPPIFCSVGLKVPSFGGSRPCLAGSRVLGGCKGTYSGGSPCFGLLEGIFGVAGIPTAQRGT